MMPAAQGLHCTSHPSQSLESHCHFGSTRCRFQIRILGQHACREGSFPFLHLSKQQVVSEAQHAILPCTR